MTEKGMMIKINDRVIHRASSPAEVHNFTEQMESLISSLSYPFILNKKTAGYAVGWKEGVDEAENQQVRELMDNQVSESGQKFIVDATAAFLDLTLRDLSKAQALKTVMERVQGKTWIACGDSANTDGPMLVQAGSGIMVEKSFRQFPVADGYEDILEVLEIVAEMVGK
ncbi:MULTISPECIES: HAD hydrolase family protein [Rhizobium]|uniref:HAD hydrolase family protein n=2 Tax=Rhizobium TaxID=379 RepID=A0ABY8IT93_9HYPH|nr:MULTISPECIES: HAD hydrolase family protein [Rhizobium]TQX81257.1 hypothetical protein EQW76_28570 [Rhizobium sp. rho-13.1]TQY04956.1 hypothetical protein EQW74_27880 [Rhizobium sp. rho-1.1]WFS26403.1 HAD hydrolase family protein [Rhizobium rhododendri]